MYQYVFDALNKIPVPDSLPQYSYLRSYLFPSFGRFEQEKARNSAFTEWYAVGKRILLNGGIVAVFRSVLPSSPELVIRYATESVLFVYFSPTGDVCGALAFAIDAYGRYAGASHTLTELSDGNFRLYYQFSSGDDQGNYSEGSIDYYFRPDTALCVFVEARPPVPHVFNGEYRNPATGEQLSISTQSPSESYDGELLLISYWHKKHKAEQISPINFDEKSGIINLVFPKGDRITRFVFSPSHTQFTAYSEDGSPPQIWDGTPTRLW